MAETTVYNFIGLRNAITDNTIDVIKLGSDINFTSGSGAIIPRTKSQLLIDGQGFTITDYNSSASADTIRFNTTSGGAVTITIQNIIWSGRNYYGIIYVPDASNNDNITIILNNVQYTGLQAIYNRYGITRLIDSTFEINQNGTSVAVNEFGEVNRLIIEGNVRINSLAPNGGNSVIWFPHANSLLTIETNANFIITAPYTYVFYSDTEPVAVFNENSTTNITSGRGLFLYAGATNHMFSTFSLKTGASFYAKTGRTSSTIPIFKCRNSFVLEQDSMFFLATETSGTGTLIDFAALATLSFNNPKSVVLYNNGGNVFSFNAGTTANPNIINIEAELLNRWTSAASFATAGNFDDIPTRAMAKADYSNIIATINATTSATSSISSNIIDADIGYPMNASTFNIMNVKVLSMGNIKINLNEISDISPSITGTTEKSANLRATYNGTTLTGVSGLDGNINLPVLTPITADSNLNFGVNWKFLTKFIKTITVGSISITHLPDLIFKAFFVPSGRRIIDRKDPMWYIEITDTRTSGSDWYLYASLPTPLSTGIDNLDDALILKEQSIERLMTPSPILIRQQSYLGNPPIITQITWEEIEGFLLQVDPGFYYNKGLYTSNINWELRISPLI